MIDQADTIDLLRAGVPAKDLDLTGADLRDADLRGCDLRGADLLVADLTGADLRGCDLRGARLRGADLLGADLRGADLRGAGGLLDGYLEGATYNEDTMWPEYFSPEGQGMHCDDDDEGAL